MTGGTVLGNHDDDDDDDGGGGGGDDDDDVDGDNPIADDAIRTSNSGSSSFTVVCDEHFGEVPGDLNGEDDENRDGDQDDEAADEDDAEEVEESNENPMMKTCLRLSMMMMDSSAEKTN